MHRCASDRCTSSSFIVTGGKAECVVVRHVLVGRQMRSWELVEILSIASDLSGIGCKIITCEDGEQVLKRWTWKHDILASSLKGSVEACGPIFNVRLVRHDCVFFSRVFCCMGKCMERAEFYFFLIYLFGRISCGTWNLRCTGLVAPQHMGS